MLLQLSLTLTGLLVCAGAIVGLASLLTWQQRAPDPLSRRQRLLAAVMPLSSVLLLAMLGVFVGLMLLWSPAGQQFIQG